VQAEPPHNEEVSLVRIGFEIAPVPPNLEGKDPRKVGYGSFLVNDVGPLQQLPRWREPPHFNYGQEATHTLRSRRKPIRPRAEAGALLVLDLDEATRPYRLATNSGGVQPWELPA